MVKVLQKFLMIFLLVSTVSLVAMQEGVSSEVTEQIETVVYPEKNIVVMIPSYNNKQWYERNLASVLSQNYSNFTVIYTDDCSGDGTGELVKQYLIENDCQQKVTLVRNQVRRGPLYNMYTMVHMCDDDVIMVTLDGDDWFPDNDVLSRLNNVYSSGEIWMTYGQFQYSSSGEIGWAKPMKTRVIRNNTFRQIQMIPTHLRTFYAWLFKRIRLEDMLYMGKFFPMAGDCVVMFPVIEMAGERHKCISDVMYVYNDENLISEHVRSRQLQMHLAQIVRDKKRYACLKEKPVKKDSSDIKADVIVFAQSPAILMQLLDSIKTQVNGFDRIFVIYQPTSLQEANKYNLIRSLYPEVGFDEVDEQGEFFGDILFSIYSEIQNDHILFVKDSTLFEKEVVLSDCINALDRTGAYAFYFKLNAQDAGQSLPLIEYNKDISAWSFAAGVDQWASANSFDCVLHRKTKSLAYKLERYFGSDARGFENEWANDGRLDHVGLCFNESCIATL